MAFRTQKISQMTPKGSDLEATDLIEVSTIESGSYVTRSITGQELIDAIPVPPSGITIGTTVIASGTVGRVLFEGTGNVVQESANLFWDNTNGRLGIGTSSPSTTFAIGSGGINRVNLGIQAFEMYTPSSVRTVFLGYSSTSGQLIISSGGSNDVNFLGGGFKSISTGNFAIGSTTDAGFRLDVNGTARVQGLNGNMTFSAVGDPALVINSNTGTLGQLQLKGGAATSWIIGTQDNFLSNALIFRKGATTTMVHTASGNLLINTTTDAGFRLDVNGTARVTDLTIGTPSVDNNIRFGGNNTRIFNSIADNSLNYQSVFSASTVFRFTTNSSLPNANTSGTNVFMSLPIGFAPTSGTGTWSQLSLTPTINQTGGASGITRGLYVNPTLTAAADFRAIETTAGRVIFGGLPTSSAGLPTGAIWNDAGTLKIV